MLEIALLFLRFLPPNLKRDHRTALGPEFWEAPVSWLLYLRDGLNPPGNVVGLIHVGTKPPG